MECLPGEEAQIDFSAGAPVSGPMANVNVLTSSGLYETRSTIMTSNRPLEDWGKLLGDVPSATAILDRFLHHAEIITITGQCYRLKDRAGNSGTKVNKAPKDKDDKSALKRVSQTNAEPVCPVRCAAARLR